VLQISTKFSAHFLRYEYKCSKICTAKPKISIEESAYETKQAHTLYIFIEKLMTVFTKDDQVLKIYRKDIAL